MAVQKSAGKSAAIPAESKISDRSYRIARHIRSVITQKGWSISQLAEESGIPPRRLEAQVCGHLSFDVNDLDSVCQVLGLSIVDVSRLLRWNEDGASSLTAEARSLLDQLDVLSRRLVQIVQAGEPNDAETDQLFDVRDRMSAILDDGDIPPGGFWSATAVEPSVGA